MSPPYELFCVVRKKTNPTVLVNTMMDIANVVMREGGAVKGFQNMGVRPLPKPIKGKLELGQDRVVHAQARFATMDFDAPAPLLHTLRTYLDTNPEILRFKVHSQSK